MENKKENIIEKIVRKGKKICCSCKKKVAQREYELNMGLCRNCQNYSMGLINHLDSFNLGVCLMMISVDYQLKKLGIKRDVDLKKLFKIKKGKN